MSRSTRTGRPPERTAREVSSRRRAPSRACGASPAGLPAPVPSISAGNEDGVVLFPRPRPTRKSLEIEDPAVEGEFQFEIARLGAKFPSFEDLGGLRAGRHRPLREARMAALFSGRPVRICSAVVLTGRSVITAEALQARLAIQEALRQSEEFPPMPPAASVGRSAEFFAEQAVVAEKTEMISGPPFTPRMATGELGEA